MMMYSMKNACCGDDLLAAFSAYRMKCRYRMMMVMEMMYGKEIYMMKFLKQFVKVFI